MVKINKSIAFDEAEKTNWSDLTDLLACSDDVVLFANKCGITPDPWQADFLNQKSENALLCCSRQSGKSTITAIKALHHAMFNHRSLILLLSPSHRQSKELCNKIMECYKLLPDYLKLDAGKFTNSEITFKNGSRIVSLPEKGETIRGFSAVNLLIFDEAAYIDDEIFKTVLPMLVTTKGLIIALSTPRFTHGWFYEAWISDNWKKYMVTADQCNRISQEEIEKMKQNMSPDEIQQEFYCVFFDDPHKAFTREFIERALADAETWEG